MEVFMNQEELTGFYPILNFDPDPDAIINPPVSDVLPKKVVICFFKDVVEKVASEYKSEVIYTFRSESGLSPVFELEYKGEHIAFLEMRKQVAWYTAGYPGSARLRNKTNELSSMDDLYKLLEEYEKQVSDQEVMTDKPKQ